jgi:hypothetical protein
MNEYERKSKKEKKRRNWKRNGGDDQRNRRNVRETEGMKRGSEGMRAETE